MLLVLFIVSSVLTVVSSVDQTYRDQLVHDKNIDNNDKYIDKNTDVR